MQKPKANSIYKKNCFELFFFINLNKFRHNLLKLRLSISIFVYYSELIILLHSYVTTIQDILAMSCTLSIFFVSFIYKFKAIRFAIQFEF